MLRRMCEKQKRPPFQEAFSQVTERCSVFRAFTQELNDGIVVSVAVFLGIAVEQSIQDVVVVEQLRIELLLELISLRKIRRVRHRAHNDGL